MPDQKTITIELGGRTFGVAPLRLGDLRRAAPFIDEANAFFKREKARADEAKKAGVKPEDPSFAEMTGIMRSLCEFLAIPLMKVDPAMDADAVEDLIDFSFIGSLQSAFFALLSASGFSLKGEVTAPSETPAEGAASPASSSELSTSS